jgi:hypothetical protein
MIIGDPNIESITLSPSKTDSELIVYSDTVLSGTISLQRLEAICRRRRKVTKLLRVVDLNQSPERDGSDGLEAPYAALLEDRLRIPVAKRADQTYIILWIAFNVKRGMVLGFPLSRAAFTLTRVSLSPRSWYDRRRGYRDAE